MLSRIEQLFAALRHKLSRIEWAARLLDLPCLPVDQPEPGLVIIQIDGLAYRQFRRAMEDNRLPFLRRLLARRTHLLKQFYSGMPSTTPAVQAELFFGQKSAVPAFEFFDRETGERHIFFYPSSVEKIAAQLAQQDEALLKDGTSYSNIYAGGAREARYCVQSMKLKSFLRSANPLKILSVLILYSPMMGRIIGYGLLEFGLALSDFLRGIARKHNFFKELKFIPTRVFVCIILRELIRFRVKLDLKKGVRIIHANLVGYDEQAHRRGPDSAFAHWTLKGIDDTIKDIHRAAQNSDCRDYHLIVYSDHGQEMVQDYQSRVGKSVKEVIRAVLAKSDLNRSAPDADAVTDQLDQDPATHRFNWYFGRKTGKVADQNHPEDPGRIEITTLGPLGHIYFPSFLAEDLKEPAARLLVEQGNIPLVLFVKNGRAFGLNSQGLFDLEYQKESILGQDHPFLKWVADDLAGICHHPWAGDLLISGWKPGGHSLSFSIENGAHGGPGREETRGFILLPQSIPVAGDALRPLELRKLVQNLFDHSRTAATPADADGFSLKVMSYNIHSCINIQGRVDPVNISRVIAAWDPDVVALQEVDALKPRSNFIDQPRLLAERLNMKCYYFPLLFNGPEQFGLAILTRYPIQKVRFAQLPALHSRKPRELRGAMWIKVLMRNRPVNFVNTHLGLNRNDRLLQIRTLLGRNWGLGINENEPLILCGDLNAVARSAVYREVSLYLRDVQRLIRKTGYPKPTFFSRCPVLRIDHIFISNHFIPLKVQVPRDPRAQMASDHLPVFAELRLKTDGAR
jgi:endonuclease/exonuclease/phosphatase family metal-dependent hydrolase